MIADFEGALQELGKENLDLTHHLLAMLSCPSREEVEAFRACWPGLATSRRREILAKMVMSAEENYRLDFVDLFRHCLTDEDALVRRMAVEGLWEDREISLVNRLLELATSDPDESVRAAAATSLGRFLFMVECEELSEKHGVRIREVLQSILEDPREPLEVTRRALESMAFVNTDMVREAISRFYQHDDERMRLSAVFAMGRSADRCWGEIVLTELGSTSAAMRYEAARAAGELQLKGAVADLVQLVQQPDQQIQDVAIWALGQIGGRHAEKVLEKWAASDDAELSATASEALDELRFLAIPMDLLIHDPDEAELGELDELDDDLEEAEDDESPDDDGGWADEFLDLS